MMTIEDLLRDVEVPPEEPIGEPEPVARCPFCGAPVHPGVLAELWPALAAVVLIARRYHPLNQDLCAVMMGYKIGAAVPEVRRILDGET